jgi:hypothetical protein
MSATHAAGKGRDVVAYFAGHLAHLFNGDDRPAQGAFLEIHPFALYDKVRRSLIGNRRYADELVGVWAYSAPLAADDAVDFYFDIVIDRPIQSRRGEPSSADFLARLVASRAARPFGGLAKGEGLSIWKALTGGPTRLRRCSAGAEIFELSNRILKCLDASNRPYAEVLRLGLCPREWLVGDEAVGVNALKAANAFLKALKAEMGGEFRRRPTQAELAAAFAKAPPSNSASAEAFATSPLGAAILSRIAGTDQTYFISYDAIEDTQAAEVAEDDETPLMAPEEAAPYLTRALAAGAIDSAEHNLLAAILSGQSLAEALGDSLYLRRRIKTEFDGDVAAFVEDLSARTAKFVLQAEGRP